jgi:hypothetical protein
MAKMAVDVPAILSRKWAGEIKIGTSPGICEKRGKMPPQISRKRIEIPFSDPYKNQGRFEKTL